MSTRANNLIHPDSRVIAKYFAHHQDSALTGATSAVIWTIEKTDEHKHKVAFSFTRLVTGKERHEIANITVKGA